MRWARHAVKSSRFFLQGNRTRPSYLAHSSRYPRPLHLSSTNGISRAYASSNHQCGNCRADGTECGLVVWFRHSRQRPQLHRLQPQRTGRRKRLARLHRLPVQDRRRLPPGPSRHRRGLRGGHPGVPPTGPRSHHRATAGPAIWPTTSSTCRTRPSPPRGGKNTAPWCSNANG